MIHHIHRATRHLIFWSLLALAIGLTCLRLLLAGIDSYKADLAGNIGDVLGAPVSIGRIGAKMRGFSPELILKDIAVQSADSKTPPPIHLAEIRLGASLFEMLKTQELLSSAWVTVIGAKFSLLRYPDGHLGIAGIAASEGSPQWLLQGKKFAMLNSEITWHDQKAKAKPLLFDTVDLVLKNTGQRHQLNLLAHLPKAYGESLRVSMDLTGNALEASALTGQVYAEGKQLHLAELTAMELPLAIRINSGIGNVQVWGDWEQALPKTITVVADLQQGKFMRPDREAYAIKQLQTQLRWQQSAKHWHLHVDNLALVTPDRKWPDAQFNLAGTFTDSQGIGHFGAFLKHIELQEMAELAHHFLPLPEAKAKLLADLQLHGALENTAMFIDVETQSGAINGHFKNVAMAAVGAVPGLNNLSGQIKGTDQLGTVSVDSGNAQLLAPVLFREPLAINRLKGDLIWQQMPTKWLLAGNGIIAEVPGLSTQTQLKLDIPKAKGLPVMDLETSFSSPDMAKAPLYLPVGIMDKPLVGWLDHAFVGGRIPKGLMTLRGNLGQFPFQDNSGLFKISFDVEQLELAYHPDWPHLQDLAGNVQFLKNGVEIKLSQGQTGDLKIKQADISIPDMGKTAVLNVKGEANGDFKQGLAFLRQTPLRSDVEPIQEAIAMQGQSKVLLNLMIPLVEEKPAKTEVITQLNQAKLNVQALDLWVSQINGPIRFTDQGIYSDGLQAQALGQAIKITIGREQEHTLVKVAGRAGVTELQQQFKLPWWSVAQGETGYHLALALPDKASEPLQLDVQSDLQGIALELPGELAKNTSQKRPLAVTFDLNQKSSLPITLNYDNKLTAALKFNIAQQQISSGHVLVGEGKAKFSNEAGLALEINRDKLAVQDWLGLAVAQNKDSLASSAIRKITVHSEHALWKTTDIGRFDLQLKPDRQYWLGDLQSKVAVGKVRLPSQQSDVEKIVFTMQQLDLSALAQLKSKTGDASVGSKAFSPEMMPLFSLNSDATFWRNHDLGMLHVETERIAGGIVFKHIDVFGHDQKLTATGNWKLHGQGSQTQIQGRLEMPQAGKMLANLGITKDISEASGVADFLLHWPAAPYQFSLPKLNGQLTINLARGRILSIEPGFGRILGVLALAQWINRLQLDFSDIYQEGLTFNSIKGRFDLVNGNAVTRNLVVDAIPAKITLTGETDLVKQTVDQVVNVSPKSADAVPIAGTIMGKITTLVAKSLTGKDQEGFFFGSQYLLKGKWGNVQTVPLHENDGVLQKIWDGIGRFPWIQQPIKP